MAEIKDMTPKQLMSVLKDANASEKDKQAAEWYFAVGMRAAQRGVKQDESEG